MIEGRRQKAESGRQIHCFLPTAFCLLLFRRGLEFTLLDGLDQFPGLIASDQRLSVVVCDFIQSRYQALRLGYALESQIVCEYFELFRQIQRLISLGVLSRWICLNNSKNSQTIWDSSA